MKAKSGVETSKSFLLPALLKRLEKRGKKTISNIMHRKTESDLGHIFSFEKLGSPKQ
jgi:hypothetical protein